MSLTTTMPTAPGQNHNFLHQSRFILCMYSCLFIHALHVPYCCLGRMNYIIIERNFNSTQPSFQVDTIIVIIVFISPGMTSLLTP